MSLEKFVKTEKEIEIMREGGKILAIILKELESMIQPGLDIWELELKFLALCKKNNVLPSCKNYRGRGGPPFPAGLCVSINDESVHCYPVKGRLLNNGDNILVDTVIKHRGIHVDSAFSAGVGTISTEKERQLNTTLIARQAGINIARAGCRVGDVSNAIQTVVEMAGFSVLREYTGHGIGKDMHEPPSIPCYGEKGTGERLLEGMTITIEPLVCSKKPDLVYENNNYWRTKTADGGFFTQFEHTILIKKDGSEVLTKL